VKGLTGTIELDAEELDGLVRRAEGKELRDGDAALIKALVDTVKLLSSALEQKNLSIGRLKRMLFGAKTEKTANVVQGRDGKSAAAQKKNKKKKKKKKRVGHGRNGADAYRGAEKVSVAHSSLRTGDLCPLCPKGKLYKIKRPAVVVRVVGRSPLQATVYELQKLRCNLCGEVFTAKPPEGCGEGKYASSAGSIIAVLKYGYGLPFNRLEKLQENFQIPLPASTQWQIVEKMAAAIYPLYDELIREAAQGQVLHNDDTAMMILELAKAIEDERERDPKTRTGIFTTGILSRVDGHKIALFHTGRKHAGENLTDLLARRESNRSPPIQMCDALSRNLPEQLAVILANCLSHARRKFVDIVSMFPEECRYVLETLKLVYNNDHEAKSRQMSPEERLRFHQSKSGPPMRELNKWLHAQMDEKKIEPNSAAGQAFSYMLRHWGPLTLFLRVPGAPLDNNLCEQALKRAILHRKNSMFFKTQHGADVGDLFMSIIHTCNLAGVNAFEYLNALETHATELSQQPHLWMPWNYTEQLSDKNAKSA
jgi:transposase